MIDGTLPKKNTCTYRCECGLEVELTNPQLQYATLPFKDGEGRKRKMFVETYDPHIDGPKTVLQKNKIADRPGYRLKIRRAQEKVGYTPLINIVDDPMGRPEVMSGEMTDWEWMKRQEKIDNEQIKKDWLAYAEKENAERGKKSVMGLVPTDEKTLEKLTKVKDYNKIAEESFKVRMMYKVPKTPDT